MRTHLLRVEDEAATYAPVFAAARALGLRVGWLELGESARTEPAPAPLAAAAALGALRAVAVGGGRAVALKPLRGPAVLKDLLREHFTGCALVLVRGEVDAPVLRAADGGWRVRRDDEERAYDSARLAAALRSPKAFDFDGAV